MPVHLDTPIDCSYFQADRNRQGKEWVQDDMGEGIFSGLKNRVLQSLAKSVPGAQGLRVRLHRWRGVEIGEGTWIGQDAMIETSMPHLVSIGSRSIIGIRATIVAHFREAREDKTERSVVIGNRVFIGPGAIILPNVTIGDGAVVTAGSVVTTSVPEKTMVQGNPAKPVAICEKPLVGEYINSWEFTRGLKPIK